MRKKNAERNAKMVTMYNVEKLSYGKIGAKFNITRQRVEQILSKQGVKARPMKDCQGNYAKAEKLKHEILKCYMYKKMTLKEMRKEFKIPSNILSMTIKKMLKTKRLASNRKSWK